MKYAYNSGPVDESPTSSSSSSKAKDCFILASKEATSVTLVARSPAWILPQRFLGIPLDFRQKVSRPGLEIF